MEVAEVPDAELGTVTLQPSVRLVFTVGYWKGRQRAQVRKYVSTGKYSGPTKAGLSMSGPVLVEVLEALSRLAAETPKPHAQEFGRIGKRDDVEIVISIVPPDEVNGLPSVDVREFCDTPTYTGPTKKGIRFPWQKLAEVVALLQMQARQLGTQESQGQTLFAENKPAWVEKAQSHDQDRGATQSHDPIISAILPNGPRDFPSDFVDHAAKGMEVQLPAEPIEVGQQPDGKHVVRSQFGFNCPVRNVTEGSFVLYAHLRGHRTVVIPTEMIAVFRAVKAYENYLRELRISLMQAYERKTGHRPMAEHRVKEVFRNLGLPLLSPS